MGRKPRVVGDTPTHQIVVDWDGTAVPAMWPQRPTEFMPGFVDAMHRFREQGHHIVIYTARLNPVDPWTGERRAEGEMREEWQYIRDTLDKAGLEFIQIYTSDGKPGGSVYIDDKAERYHGCNGCWRRMADKVLLRLGDEDAVFPRMEHE